MGAVTTTDGKVRNGSTPTLTDGSNLPSAGVFGSSTTWMEFALGDFDTADSQLGDFINTFPTASVSNQAQINVYEVSVLNGSGATLHFDLYDSVQAGNKAKSVFAPNSHDGTSTTGGPVANVVPEPGTAAVWGVLALVGAGINRRKKRLRLAQG